MATCGVHGFHGRDRGCPACEARAEIAHLRLQLAEEVNSAELHAQRNREVAEALGQEFGETWHDLDAKVAALRARAEKAEGERDEALKSRHDAYQKYGKEVGRAVALNMREAAIRRYKAEIERLREALRRAVALADAQGHAPGCARAGPPSCTCGSGSELAIALSAFRREQRALGSEPGEEGGR